MTVPLHPLLPHQQGCMAPLAKPAPGMERAGEDEAVMGGSADNDVDVVVLEKLNLKRPPPGGPAAVFLTFEEAACLPTIERKGKEVGGGAEEEEVCLFAVGKEEEEEEE